jgi:hypothetical protein
METNCLTLRLGIENLSVAHHVIKLTNPAAF